MTGPIGYDDLRAETVVQVTKLIAAANCRQPPRPIAETERQ